MIDHITLPVEGYVRIWRQDDPSDIFFAEKNVILLNTSYLFARMMAGIGNQTSATPQYGVWGLALGAGAPDWPLNSQPTPVNTNYRIITPIKRKRLMSVRFVDDSLVPLGDGHYSKKLDFQTLINATNDAITTPIREMGLIGGGSGSTNMEEAPWFNSDPGSGGSPDNINTALLINYKTFTPMKLPEGVNFIFSWVLTM